MPIDVQGSRRLKQMKAGMFCGRLSMKGYYVIDGYMGWTGTSYMLFASESDYYDYMDDMDEAA